jgi:hypothetical protein
VAIIKNVQLDFVKPQQSYILTLEQGDAIDRILDVELLNNGEVFTIPSNAICSIRAINSQNTKIDNACTVVDNKVRVIITKTMTALAERLPCQIRLVLPTSGGIIKTARFHISINPSAIKDEFIVISDSYTQLENALLQVNDWENQFQDRLKELDFSLTQDYLRNTSQVVTLNADETVQKIQHKNASNVVIREDVFTYNGDVVTEVRTMNTGESVTFTYNLSTYQTTIS